MSRPSYQRYQEIEVTTMSAPKRVVFVYTLLVSTLRAAQRHLAKNEIAERCEKLVKAKEIVFELLETLDREQGGDIAANLAALYAFWVAELTAVHIRPEAARLDKLCRMVEDLAGAWQQAAEQLPQAPAVGAVA